MEKNTTAGLGKSPVHFRHCGSDQVRPSLRDWPGNVFRRWDVFQVGVVIVLT